MSKQKVRETLDRLIDQIPLVGGVPAGHYEGRVRNDSGEECGQDPDEIFSHWLPAIIDFKKLPQSPKTVRFVLFHVYYCPGVQTFEDRIKSKTFLRFGFTSNPTENSIFNDSGFINDGYSSADRSHLSIARLATQEVFDKYNTLVDLDNLGVARRMDVNNLLFFGNGHGVSVYINLLHKRIVHNDGNYELRLVTVDGGFVTYYSDGSLVLGGESRYLSPAPDICGVTNDEERAKEVEIALRAHKSKLDASKYILEKHFVEAQLERRVTIGNYIDYCVVPKN